MGRPPLCRRVGFIPSVTFFKPAGIPLRELEEVCLSVEEIEAIRLKDLEDLEQEQCAERMKVSRPTFVRILDSARRKLAEAIIKGKAIRIEGGNFEISWQLFKCVNGHEWRSFGKIKEKNPSQTCPTCNTADITAISPLETTFGKERRGCRRGLRWQISEYKPEASIISHMDSE
jgi:uncharacterized protein